MFYRITLTSRNKKTGGMPTTMSHKGTCPLTCKLKESGTCYAMLGHTNIWWSKLADVGLTFDDLCKQIATIPYDTVWRFGVAGDFNHDNGNIKEDDLDKLITANRKKKVISFTHHVLNEHNTSLIKKAKQRGFTINASHENVEEAVKTHKTGIPSVTIVPFDFPKSKVVDGVKIVVCPEQTSGIQCQQCKICSKSDRKVVIGFKPHGVRKKQVDLIARCSSVN